MNYSFVFEMGCLRWMMWVTRQDHVRNLDIEKQLNIEWDIVDRIQTTHLCYFGHIERMEPSWLSSPLCQTAWHKTHRKTGTVLCWHCCRFQQTWSYCCESNTWSMTLTTMDEAVRKCSFCITMTLKKKKNYSKLIHSWKAKYHFVFKAWLMCFF